MIWGPEDIMYVSAAKWKPLLQYELLQPSGKERQLTVKGLYWG